jgi:CO/xanthine dehydrogenase Mo-binding subunit
VQLVETTEVPSHGTEAKGLGEAPGTGIPAAVANAIAKATARRPLAYPMTPETVLRMLSK